MSIVSRLANRCSESLILKGLSAGVSCEETIPKVLSRQAADSAGRIAIIDVSQGDEITYGSLWARASALSQGLARLELSVDRPIAILSENSIDHAVVTFAGMILGVPVSPISVAYSQFSDLTRISSLFDQLTPGLVFAEDADRFARSLALAAEKGAKTVVASGAGADYNLTDLELAEEGGGAAGQVTADTIAKLLFTSGSTGAPKAVIVTQRMICSNQIAMAAEWPFLLDEPPLIVDWLPWNHVFGGNLVLMCALRNGGTLVIDDGRPAPGLFDKTIANLTKFRPTIHFGVPRGFDLLVPALEADEAFARAYFSRLKRMFTAGAALPAATWDRYRALAKRYANDDFVPHVAWGSTETAPVVTLSPPDNARPDNLGVPVQGCEVKLVPNDDKQELRVRGPMVTPGYWRNEKATAEAFDEDGFYCIGDAGRLLENQPEKGILFDGRISENFKLVTGTWVQVNALRLAVIDALRPMVADAVICGHDRDAVGVLLFMNLEGCRELTGLPQADLHILAQNRALKDHVSQGLSQIGQTGGSSGRVACAMLLTDAPSQEDGEMTDKGYLNQRASLRKRADDVTSLFEDPNHERVVQAARSTKQTTEK